MLCTVGPPGSSTTLTILGIEVEVIVWPPVSKPFQQVNRPSDAGRLEGRRLLKGLWVLPGTV